MHKILTWNVRVGDMDKHPTIVDCVKRVKSSVVIIKETKLKEIPHQLIRYIWGTSSVGWEHHPSMGASRGVGIMSDTYKVQVVEAALSSSLFLSCAGLGVSPFSSCY